MMGLIKRLFIGPQHCTSAYMYKYYIIVQASEENVKLDWTSANEGVCVHVCICCVCVFIYLLLIKSSFPENCQRDQNIFTVQGNDYPRSVLAFHAMEIQVLFQKNSFKYLEPRGCVLPQTPTAYF